MEFISVKPTHASPNTLTLAANRERAFAYKLHFLIKHFCVRSSFFFAFVFFCLRCYSNCSSFFHCCALCCCCCSCCSCCSLVEEWRVLNRSWTNCDSVCWGKRECDVDSHELDRFDIILSARCALAVCFAVLCRVHCALKSIFVGIVCAMDGWMLRCCYIIRLFRFSDAFSMGFQRDE